MKLPPGTTAEDPLRPIPRHRRTQLEGKKIVLDDVASIMKANLVDKAEIAADRPE